MRIYILHGQGYSFSLGFNSLADQLEVKGHKVTQHSWDANILSALWNQDTFPTLDQVAIIGHSLGANQLGYISDHLGRSIGLGIAYDPSRLSPLVHDGVQRAPNFKSLVVYSNPSAWIYGGSTYVGSNVVDLKVNAFHLGITYDQSLHQRTIKVIEAYNAKPNH